jgi:hypothetical protein
MPQPIRREYAGAICHAIGRKRAGAPGKTGLDTALPPKWPAQWLPMGIRGHQSRPLGERGKKQPLPMGKKYHEVWN